jgi:hypothetical protein
MINFFYLLSQSRNLLIGFVGIEFENRPFLSPSIAKYRLERSFL